MLTIEEIKIINNEKLSTYLCSILYKILTILILPFSIYASDVYYCVDDDKVGFEPEENFVIKSYNLSKFKIKIDFEKGTVESPDLYFESHNNPKCTNDGTSEYGTSALSCIHSLGYTIVINENNLKYYRSAMFNPGISSDSVIVAHGSCEKF